MRKLLSLLVAGAFTLTLGACDGDDSVTAPETSSSVLEVTAVHEGDQFRFELSDHEIPSGWTTIELDNQTQATHFAFLRKAGPEFLAGMREDYGAISPDAYQEESALFQEAWNPYYEGEITFGEFLGRLAERTAPWFSDHRPIGGPGLTSGGVTSRTTQNLEPGTYFIECYVIGEDGVFHTLGMVEKVVVTGASSDGREPRPTMRITLDDDGIHVEDAQGPPGPGWHTVAVTFEENGTPSGHDLHLIRLDAGTTVPEVNAWMDWPDATGTPPVESFYNTDEFGPALTSYHDAPGPQTWMGGVQDIQPPLPETAYFHVQLKSGDYAWVSEIANPEARGFLETFTVP